MEPQTLLQRIAALGAGPKTARVDALARALLREGVDVAALEERAPGCAASHRIFFQVSLARCADVTAQLDWIEAHAHLLQDWWHVDQLPQFLYPELTFAMAYARAQRYVHSPMPFLRRWGYVIFFPSLVKDPAAPCRLFALLQEDGAYYVQMAQAWLLSELAVHAPDETLAYLSGCNLPYAIVGKAIQKVCDSYRIAPAQKQRFRALRAARRGRG